MKVSDSQKAILRCLKAQVEEKLAEVIAEAPGWEYDAVGYELGGKEDAYKTVLKMIEELTKNEN